MNEARKIILINGNDALRDRDPLAPPKPMQTYAIIFDIDGTLADPTHRLPLLDDPAKKEEFYEAMPLDEVLPAAVLYNMLVRQSMMMIDCHRENPTAPIPLIDVVTARPERHRRRTVLWMKNNGLMPPHDLHMRSNNDPSSAVEFKRALYERLYADKTVQIVFEDDNACVEMWRGLGIPCFQVAPGQL